MALKGSRRFALIVAIAVAGTVVGTTPAQAYDRTKAVSWANTMWHSRSGSFPSFSDDCTNFVSQSIFKGGVYMRFPPGGPPPGKYNNANYWYASGTLDYSYTWSVAGDNYYFQGVKVPGSTYYYVTHGTQGAYTPGSHTSGDPVYYDWDDNGTIDHASILVGIGTDPTSTSYYGNLVNQHSTDRYHAIWHLRPYNIHYSTTNYPLVHLSNTAS
jgi:hypothetical protein